MPITVREIVELFSSSCPGGLCVRILGESPAPVFSGPLSDSSLRDKVLLGLPARRCFWSLYGVLDIDVLDGGDTDV